MALISGMKLDAYRIDGLLGAGGMGEVYRARDMTLGRDVAIKVLPALVSQDPDRLRRFQLEARSAAALNHPNILAVFQMGTHDGVPYLVSELLEGSTIREQLVRGPISIRKTTEYAIQIARGLAAAHNKGIVHRDLKPENLFVTEDGRVKILDFGLAKLTECSALPDQPAPTATKATEPGLVMGTVGYMSPEQVRGIKADPRTDIFALGAILYEALTGRRTFQKATSAETMSAILNEDPPAVSQIAPNVPVALQKVVHRCLEKSPEQRFQSASDLAFALEALSDAGSSPAAALVSSAKLPRRSAYFIVGAAVALVAVLAMVVLRRRSALIPPTEWVQITNFADSVTSPALSPDGRMLTFLRGEKTFVTTGQVYVMLLPHGDPVRLTNDAAAKMSPVFSADGSSINYTVPWDTWTVPVLGGQPRLWLPNASGLTWLDPGHVMYSQITGGEHMALVSSELSRAQGHSIYSPESSLGMAHRSYVSPDRKWVIVVEMTGNFWDRCRLVSLDGGTHSAPIGPTDGACTAAAWSPDGHWMYLNTNSGNAFHLWRQRFPNGKIEQITSGPTEEEGIALAPDGTFLVTAVGMRRSSVWLHDSRGDRMLTSEATAALGDPRSGSPFSPDGKKLYYLVRRAPGREISSDIALGELWEMDLQSGVPQPLLPGFSITEFSLSPDGHDIAFTALAENGAQAIWVAPLDRSSPPRLLQTSAEHPRFTSNFVYYIKRGAGGSYAHRIHPDGSGDQQIWNEKILAVAASPDGRYLAVTVPIQKNGQWMLEIVDWARKRVHPVCKDALGYWSDDGRSFVLSANFSRAERNALSYVITLAPGSSVPDLPPRGISDSSQLAALPHARTIPQNIVAPGGLLTPTRTSRRKCSAISIVSPFTDMSCLPHWDAATPA